MLAFLELRHDSPTAWHVLTCPADLSALDLMGLLGVFKGKKKNQLLFTDCSPKGESQSMNMNAKKLAECKTTCRAFDIKRSTQMTLFYIEKSIQNDKVEINGVQNNLQNTLYYETFSSPQMTPFLYKMIK